MSPVLFTIGSFNVYAFGFFLSLAFLFSTFIVWKNAKEELAEEEYLDAFLYTSLASLIASRLGFILFHFNEFGLNFLKYIVVRETPGLSLVGGLFGGFIFLFWYARRIKRNFWKLLDLFSLASSFALILAKLGEQLGGAGFGRETNFFLGIKIIGLPGKHHPVELYEAFLLSILTLILYLIYKRVKRNILPEGLVASIFGIGLALIIFLLEFLKVYNLYLYGLSFRQVGVLILLVAIVVPLIIKFKRRSQKNNENYT
ncbi:prolipoprotein diacylglyceryl transferase [Candidatus Gottesmanbacteria bacterium]|nr:prolipoprotein diacylglyceryl transferase [Candidatus Gottesmanbacteria bacterium]